MFSAAQLRNLLQVLEDWQYTTGVIDTDNPGEDGKLATDEDGCGFSDEGLREIRGLLHSLLKPLETAERKNEECSILWSLLCRECFDEAKSKLEGLER